MNDEDCRGMGSEGGVQEGIGLIADLFTQVQVFIIKIFVSVIFSRARFWGIEMIIFLELVRNHIQEDA